MPATVRRAKTYIPTNPCVNGHTSPRYVATMQCVECARIARLKWLNTSGGESYVQKRKAERKSSSRIDYTRAPESFRGLWSNEFPKTRKEALARGVNFYFTGEPCVHGHVFPRGIAADCLACAAKRNAETYQRKKAKPADDNPWGGL